MPGPMDIRGDRPQPGPEQTGATPVRRLSRRNFIRTAATLTALPLLAAASHLFPGESGGVAHAAAEPMSDERKNEDRKAEIRNAPNARQLFIRPLPGTERLTDEQLNGARSYVQETINTIYASGNPVLIGYVDTLFQRLHFRSESFPDVPEIRQDIVKPGLYLRVSNKPTTQTLPYGRYVDAIERDTIAVVAVQLVESQMGQAPNSEDAIFSLINSLVYQGALASKISQSLDSRTPLEATEAFRTPGTDIDAIAKAIDATLIAYEQSKDDLEAIGVSASPELKDLHGEWERVNSLQDPEERGSALVELVRVRYFSSNSRNPSRTW